MLSVQEVAQRVPPTCIRKTSRTNVNAVAGFQPFFADDHLKPLDGAGKGVQQHLHQGTDLGGSVPPVTAMHEHGAFVLDHLKTAAQRRHQHFGHVVQPLCLGNGRVPGQIVLA